MADAARRWTLVSGLILRLMSLFAAIRKFIIRLFDFFPCRGLFLAFISVVGCMFIDLVQPPPFIS